MHIHSIWAGDRAGREGTHMRKFKMFGLTVVAAMSLMAMVGASSAFALQWNPQGTPEAASLVTGTSSVLTDSNGNHVTCSTSTATLTASGAVATASGTTNPVNYSSCSNDVLGGTTTVSTFGTWSFTATSTSAITAVANNGAGGTVARINMPGLFGTCTITVAGPITIAGNAWSNTTHQMTINNTVSFNLSQNGPCAGAVGATGTLSGKYQLPSTVTIS